MNEREKLLKKAKKKKALAWLILLIGVVITAVVVLNNPDSELGPIIFLGFPVLSLYVGMSASKKIERIKHSFCEQCGYHFNYNDDVAWEEVSRETRDKYVLSSIEFECHCRNCENIQNFTESFKLVEYTSSGQVKKHNVSTDARKYFI